MQLEKRNKREFVKREGVRQEEEMERSVVYPEIFFGRKGGGSNISWGQRAQRMGIWGL
jgi:hypothetical protein